MDVARALLVNKQSQSSNILALSPLAHDPHPPPSSSLMTSVHHMLIFSRRCVYPDVYPRISPFHRTDRAGVETAVRLSTERQPAHIVGRLYGRKRESECGHEGGMHLLGWNLSAVEFEIESGDCIVNHRRLVTHVCSGPDGRIHAILCHRANEHQIVAALGIEKLLEVRSEEGIRLVL